MLTDSTFWDRTFFLVLGMVIGLFGGYTTFAWREAREALKEAHLVHEDCIRIQERLNMIEKDEGGFFDFREKHRVLGNLALLLVVLLTVWAAFAAQSASNRSDEALQQQAEQTATIQRTQYCTEAFMNTTLTALNERTQFNSKQSAANLKLQKSQAKFLAAIMDPNAPEDSGSTALRKYFRSLTAFNEAVTASLAKARTFPYPKSTDYRDCLNRTRELELPK